MKKTFLLLFVACGLVAAPVVTHAEENDESQQIQILQSSSSNAQQKRIACSRLKSIGTRHSVDALAGLLEDDQLSIYARYALESMPDAAAERALLAALPKTTGALQIGIIDSLGARGDKDAIPDLGKMLSSGDTNVAIASAQALGRIGGTKSLQLLETAAASPSPAHQAEIEGILTCANQLLDAHKSKDALKAFEQLYQTEKSETVHRAAFRGILFASGNSAIPRIADTILNGDGSSQSAALLAAAQWPASAKLTRALSDALPKGSIAVQVALIKCLADRNDPAAAPAVAKLADSADQNVSVAAIAALGKLGNESVVALLADKAASGDAATRDTARESLLNINRGKITSKMLALLKSASTAAKAKVEIINAFAPRQDKSAVPALLDVAQNGSEAERTAAFQTLGQLAGQPEIPKLVQLVSGAKQEDVRLGAADALNSVLQRTSAPGAELDAFVEAVKTGNNETRIALLPICSEVVQSPVRDALRTAVADSDASVRDAAIHALCESKDAGLLPDMLKIAQETNQPASRFLAIRACVRLTTQDESVKLQDVQKVGAFVTIMQTPLNAQEKQLVLSGMGKVADVRTLRLASKMLEDADVRAEAERAVIEIATGISKTDPSDAREALQKVVKETPNDQVRKDAKTALKKIK